MWISGAFGVECCHFRKCKLLLRVSTSQELQNSVHDNSPVVVGKGDRPACSKHTIDHDVHGHWTATDRRRRQIISPSAVLFFLIYPLNSVMACMYICGYAMWVSVAGNT